MKTIQSVSEQPVLWLSRPSIETDTSGRTRPKGSANGGANRVGRASKGGRQSSFHVPIFG